MWLIVDCFPAVSGIVIELTEALCAGNDAEDGSDEDEETQPRRKKAPEQKKATAGRGSRGGRTGGRGRGSRGGGTAGRATAAAGTSRGTAAKTAGKKNTGKAASNVKSAASLSAYLTQDSQQRCEHVAAAVCICWRRQSLPGCSIQLAGPAYCILVKYEHGHEYATSLGAREPPKWQRQSCMKDVRSACFVFFHC